MPLILLGEYLLFKSVVKRVKGQIVEQDGLIEKSWTSTGEKQGRLLSAGACLGPRDADLLPDWISAEEKERSDWIVGSVRVYEYVLCTNISSIDWQQSFW